MLIAFPVACVLVGASACARKPDPVAPLFPPHVPGHMVGYHDIRPDAPPPPKAVLLYDTSQIPVTVKAQRRGDDFTINVLTHDDLFDFERYVARPDLFAVVHAAGEDYAPPIPILQFPLNLGGPGWSWSGTLSSEQDPHPACATVTTRPDSLTVGQMVIHAVRADVDMVIAPYRGAPEVERRMSFWFGHDHGLIKRDFAETNVRVPVIP